MFGWSIYSTSVLIIRFVFLTSSIAGCRRENNLRIKYWRPCFRLRISHEKKEESEKVSVETMRCDVAEYYRYEYRYRVRVQVLSVGIIHIRMWSLGRVTKNFFRRLPKMNDETNIKLKRQSWTISRVHEENFSGGIWNQVPVNDRSDFITSESGKILFIQLSTLRDFSAFDYLQSRSIITFPGWGSLKFRGQDEYFHFLMPVYSSVSFLYQNLENKIFREGAGLSVQREHTSIFPTAQRSWSAIL